MVLQKAQADSTTSICSSKMNYQKTTKKGMFVTEDGQNVLFTFLLLILLFALWGFCNGMIDVMDKHFQEVLHLTLSQSASVQFAHYLGYFLMALRRDGWPRSWGTKAASSRAFCWWRWAGSGLSRPPTSDLSGRFWWVSARLPGMADALV